MNSRLTTPPVGSAAENVLVLLRDGALGVSEAVVGDVLAAVDVIRAILDGLASTQEEPGGDKSYLLRTRLAPLAGAWGPGTLRGLVAAVRAEQAVRRAGAQCAALAVPRRRAGRDPRDRL